MTAVLDRLDALFAAKDLTSEAERRAVLQRPCASALHDSEVAYTRQCIASLERVIACGNGSPHIARLLLRNLAHLAALEAADRRALARREIAERAV